MLKRKFKIIMSNGDVHKATGYMDYLLEKINNKEIIADYEKGKAINTKYISSVEVDEYGEVTKDMLNEEIGLLNNVISELGKQLDEAEKDNKHKTATINCLIKNIDTLTDEFIKEVGLDYPYVIC